MGGILGQEGAKGIVHRNYKQFRIVMKAKCTEAWGRNEVRETGQIMESIFLHMKEFGLYPIDVEE